MAASAVPTSPGRKRLLYFGESFDGANAYSPSPVGSAASSALHLVAVAAGRLHLLALSNDGQVYAMGNGSQGQLGLGPTVTHASSLQQVELGERAKRISCGPWTSAAITVSGQCYVWGSLQPKTSFSPVRISLSTGSQFEQIEMGESHLVSLIVSSAQSPATPVVTAVMAPASACSTSSGSSASLSGSTAGNGTTVSGSGSPSDAPSPSSTPSRTSHDDAAGGPTISLVGTWGRSQEGALGRGPETSSDVPKLIHFFDKLHPIAVSAGATHSAALIASGEVYVWGKYGVADKEFIPLKIKGLKACTQLWCLNRAVFASLADNTLYSWGASGGTPMLGHGDVKDRNTPKRIDNMERCSISNIASGTAHTICCTAEGHLYGWGNGRNGQMGNEGMADVLRPMRISSIDAACSVACCERATYVLVAIPIFGTALEELGEVPELVGQILEILEKEEGIFRLNGAADVIDAIAALYNRGGRSNDLHTKGAYTLAGLLNKYLLDLPDPPIPRSFRRAFLEAANHASYTTRLEKFEFLIQRLPPCHRQLLAMLLPYFKRVTTFAEFNKMTDKNMGMVILPAIFGGDTIQDFQNMHLYARAMSAMIVLGSALFEGLRAVLPYQLEWIVQQTPVASAMVLFMRESIGKYEFDDIRAAFIEAGGLTQLAKSGLSSEIQSTQQWSEYRDILSLFLPSGTDCAELTRVIQNMRGEQESAPKECVQVVATLLHTLCAAASEDAAWLACLPELASCVTKRTAK